jgi:hypothetical protein
MAFIESFQPSFCHQDQAHAQERAMWIQKVLHMGNFTKHPQRRPWASYLLESTPHQNFNASQCCNPAAAATIDSTEP